jgi:hypothetical protein
MKIFFYISATNGGSNGVKKAKKKNLPLIPRREEYHLKILLLHLSIDSRDAKSIGLSA